LDFPINRDGGGRKVAKRTCEAGWSGNGEKGVWSLCWKTLGQRGSWF
jgi:hypothetical protein